jgi:hypothetical protein
MHKQRWYPIVTLVILLISGTASGQTTPQIGIRGGIGTDASLGLAYGLGGNFMIDIPNNSLELGVIFFGGSYEESSDEGMHTYDETTDLMVFGFVASYLIGYVPRQPGLFYIAGIGLASISVDWEERSDTDVSLGTSLPEGGSMQSEDGTGGGMVFNLGIGRSFSNGLDIRTELPVIVTFAPPGEASAVVPNMIATVGYRF